MHKITLELDDELLRMLNEINDHYEKETRIKVPLEHLIKELIIAHYYIEIELKKGTD